MTSPTAFDQAAQSAAASGHLLRNKVVIITGASRGIGATAARAFARAGAAVVLAARDEQAMTRVAQDIVSDGGQSRVVPTDVGDPAAVERLVRRTIETYGHLDAAFNNAGEGHLPAPLADIAVEDFDRVLRVNLRGVFLAMKYEIPAMLESGGGAIVNMTSTAGLRGVRGLASYVAGKHGVVGLTQSAALEYAPQNIRVNAVAPGPILTDRIGQLSEEARRPIAAAVPMGRIGRAEEVSALAVWLCSDQAAFVTGAVIPIDGGRLAGGA
jgi:NAD(P)-dependent dehydrogenase (short-subunit alcohol dehydrogenase family)